MQETATTAIARHEAWVAGEVLIDRIPDGRGGRVQVVGGGSANTAKALARLGVRTCFIDGISTDDLGMAARAELEASGVDLGRSRCSEKPTAIAEVTLDAAGNARYVFRLDGTATFDFAEPWLPHGAPAVLHVAALAVRPADGVSCMGCVRCRRPGGASSCHPPTRALAHLASTCGAHPRTTVVTHAGVAPPRKSAPRWPWRHARGPLR
jgi:hypothetical protein